MTRTRVSVSISLFLFFFFGQIKLHDMYTRALLVDISLFFPVFFVCISVSSISAGLSCLGGGVQAPFPNSGR